MSVQLLDKLRRINKLLHYDDSNVVYFGDICRVMSAELEAGVVVISGKGKILGHEFPSFEPLWPALGFAPQDCKRLKAIVAPVEISRVRLGTLFIYREQEYFDVDDIILTEHGTMIIGLEMRRSLTEEVAKQFRMQQAARSAVSTLSASELDAVRYILEELGGTEGILVASKIADRVGITRSVIVNALRKLESADIIESRSSGMKGTYIHIKNDLIIDELEKLAE